MAFTYTASGRRESASDDRGLTSWTYDDRDRLKSLTYPDGRTLEYAYDDNGNRTQLQASFPPVGSAESIELTTGYTYDDANRLDVVTDAALRTYDHGYDANGNRTSLSQPNGTETSYTYDHLNRLTNLSTMHGTTPVQSYSLTLGLAGNRLQIVEDYTVRSYGYDELYRLTSDTVTIGALNQYSKGFAYDDVGNRQTQTTSIGPAGSVIPSVLVNGTQAYTYDERDRLTTETLDANPATTYGWDVDGNLISKSAEAMYEWDREMRMVRVTKTDGTVVEHVYDFDGNRVQTTTTPAGGSAATTNYLVDTSGSPSHVVAETNTTGGLVAHYVRGDDLLAVMRPNGSGGWASRFYHSDHIGSVRRLTDETGTITDGYTYTAFGELLAHTGTDPQPYAFTGEPYDPNVGFQYHRARWMDSDVGRFVAADPFRTLGAEPSALHRYLYAAAGPLNSVDPTCWFTVSESLSVNGIINTLNTGTRILQVAQRVYRTAEAIKDAIDYARLAMKLVEALTAPTPQGVQAAVISALVGQLPPDGANGIAAAFSQAFDAIGDHWEDMSRALVENAPMIGAEASAEATRRLPSYAKAEASGRLKFIVFLPTGPGSREADTFVNVGSNMQIAFGPLGGRLFGFGIRTSKANYDQVFRVDYWEHHGLDLHYHVYSGLGRTIWRP